MHFRRRRPRLRSYEQTVMNFSMGMYGRSTT
jgi:hypothetical protein